MHRTWGGRGTGGERMARIANMALCWRAGAAMDAVAHRNMDRAADLAVEGLTNSSVRRRSGSAIIR